MSGAGIVSALAFLRARLASLAAVRTALGVTTESDALARIVAVRAEPTAALTDGPHLVLYRPRLTDQRVAVGCHTLTCEITVEAAFPPTVDPDDADAHLDAMADAIRTGEEDFEVDCDGVITDPGAPAGDDGGADGRGWSGWHRGTMTVRLTGAA